MLFQLEHSSQRRDVTLYFGCCHSDRDFICEDELHAFKAQGVLTTLHVAFSRGLPVEEGIKGPYVQHLIERDGADVVDKVLRRGGCMMVCGGTAMGLAVQACVVGSVRRCGGVESEDEAVQWMESLIAEGRYVQELWS
jgi:sulfite reductase alpha subunit-like flavoprotein